jgi:hypothetical protein
MHVLPGIAYRIGIFGQPRTIDKKSNNAPTDRPFFLNTSAGSASSILFVGVSAAVLDAAGNVVPAYAYGPTLQSLRLSTRSNTMNVIPTTVLLKPRSQQIFQNLVAAPPNGSFGFTSEDPSDVSDFAVEGRFEFQVNSNGDLSPATAPKPASKVEFSPSNGMLIRSAPPWPLDLC